MKSYRELTEEINKLFEERRKIAIEAVKDIIQVLKEANEALTAPEIMARVKPESVMSANSLYGLSRGDSLYHHIRKGPERVIKRKFVEVDELGNPLPNAPIKEVEQKRVTYVYRR